MIRTPGSPEDSFSDDPLRMMRAARFAAQLDFTPDPAVVAAMTAMAERITIVSAERVRDELVKLVLRAVTRGSGWTCWSPPASPTTCCPNCPRCGWSWTSTTGTRTCTSTR